MQKVYRFCNRKISAAQPYGRQSATYVQIHNDAFGISIPYDLSNAVRDSGARRSAKEQPMKYKFYVFELLCKYL